MATIEAKYNRDFGVRSDMQLGTLLEKTGATSLTQLLKSGAGKKND